MFIAVCDREIDVTEIESKFSKSTKVGALVAFTGLVREFSEDPSENFYLEHYPGMTEKMLTKIAQEAIERFGLIDVAIVHRVGEMLMGDKIVVVMAASSHRQAAFDGASFMMDYLKTRAPFWKKEGKSKWVSAKEDDETAFLHWTRE